MAEPTVLTISSHVAAGPVGNAAIVPALLALGITPISVSTVLLSNHPGHGKPEGLAIPAETLRAMLNRIGSLRFIGKDTVILTGYFANAQQVEAVARFIKDHPYTYYLCDPVIGDNGGLYVREDVAVAIRDHLLPLADGICPNAFELGWLVGATVSDLDSAKTAATHFPAKDVVVTSLPDGDRLLTAAIKGDLTTAVARPRLDDVPHGTGDLLSGLIAGRIAQGAMPRSSLENCINIVEGVIAASRGTDVLNLAQGLKNLG
jgi:pyridoxine kinase